MRLVHLVVTSCKDCPYAKYNSNYGMSFDSGWDCDNPDSPVGRIVDEWEISNDNNKNPKDWPPIPINCPLPHIEK